jgi:OOP family OmpA-OmpF porin
MKRCQTPSIDGERVARANARRRARPLGLSFCVALVGLAGAGLAGCARSARMDARATQLSSRLTEAEAQGAMRCAPRELAIAQSHLEFARLEGEQGDAARALAHLDIADENVRAAQLLSAPGRCEDPSEVIDASRDRGAPAAATARPLRRSHAR